MKLPQPVPASLVKRGVAYALDTFIVLIPLGYALFFASQNLFRPSLLVGWVTVSVLLLCTLFYGLILATQNASTGQTIGKKIVGIRTLRAESYTTGDFSDAFARGFWFFLGLLGLGIAPLRMAVLSKNKPQSSLWPHSIGNTCVLDVLRGQDPLVTEERFYPTYPEEWVQRPQHRLNPLYPPAPFTANYTKHSQESAPPRTTPSDYQQRAYKARRRRSLKAACQLLTTALATMLVASATLFAAVSLNPDMPKPRDEREVLASDISAVLPVAAFTGEGFPGYSPAPNWSSDVAQTAKVFATSQHVYIFNNRELTILEANTGQPIRTLELDAAVDIATTTVFDQQEGLFWAIGNTAYGWRAGLEDTQPFSAELPTGASPYTAGQELLFAALDEKTETYKAWNFTPTGFTEVTVKSGFIPGSFFHKNFISYNSSGEIRISTLDGQDVAAYPLRRPHETYAFDGVVSSGNGKIVASWSPYPDSVAPTNPVIIAFYDALTGDLLSYIETEQERINSYPSLTWGQGGNTAFYAGYMFDVETGRAVADIKAQNIEPVASLGRGVLGSSSLGNVYMTDTEIFSISGITPLDLSPNQAIIREHSGRIKKYTSTTAENNDN